MNTMQINKMCRNIYRDFSGMGRSETVVGIISGIRRAEFQFGTRECPEKMREIVYS